MKKHIQKAIKQHIKNGGMVTDPESLIDAIWSEEFQQKLFDHVASISHGSMTSGKFEGQSVMANKREKAAAKAFLKFLGVEPTDEMIGRVLC